MNDKLTDRDVGKLVAEVSRLEQEKNQLITKDQVADILRELNLSEDLLDEAMARVKKRDLVVANRLKTAAGVVAVTAVVAIAGTGIYMTGLHHTQQLVKVSASQIEVAMSESGAEGPVSSGSGETFVRVTLRDVPIGDRLPMQAKWIQPDGNVYHKNSWHTKETTTSTWDTHARCQIDKGAPVGDWQVQIYVSNNLVATKKFVVK